MPSSIAQPMMTTLLSQEIPDRVIRRRVRGYKTPANTRYCGRGGRYGNPLELRSCIEAGYARDVPTARRVCGDLFRFWVLNGSTEILTLEEREPYLAALPDLFRYDHLSCWCPLAEPCHVDAIRVGLAALAGRLTGPFPRWGNDWLLSTTAERFRADVQLATTRGKT